MGLGRVERAILEYLQLAKDCGGCKQAEGCTLPDDQKNWNKPGWRTGAQIAELCIAVEGLAECPHEEDWLEHVGEYTDARYQSVARAVRSLKRKGLTQTETVTVSYDSHGVELLWVTLA